MVFLRWSHCGLFIAVMFFVVFFVCFWCLCVFCCDGVLFVLVIFCDGVFGGGVLVIVFLRLFCLVVAAHQP